MVPKKKNKVFCIMTHDASNQSNVGVVMQALKQKGGYTFHTLKKDERDYVTDKGKITQLLHFFLVHPYHLATATIILQDNIFLPMAYIRFSKRVKVIQLWHGTGTIKKFGQSANEGELLLLEKAADQTITHLIVNGVATHEIYKEAFGVEEDNIYEIGLPRTDVLFDSRVCAQQKREFYEKYPRLKGKQLILYAPTFRDSEVQNPKIAFDVKHIVENLPEDTYLGIKLHPFVARHFKGFDLPESLKEKVYDFSYEKDTNQLLQVADILITDYSSIIFEYCILRKPMIFYAYDYKSFKEEQRGFYEDYTKFVPGEIAYTEDELVKLIKEQKNELAKIDAFVEKQYRYLDGKSTERLIELINS